ncbi:SIMPL domain-containing protein [Cellulomonas sp. McL0617]|uniref:SIMPL domain-containing protein n=1 Tax=Cellulomonas sp. McL0617 TaxID=3415675 RepID=UPI003CE75C5B
MPDVVIAELGAESRGLDAGRALLLASAALTRITDSLQAGGLDARALQTRGTSSWTDGDHTVARTDLSVTLRGVDTAGDLLGAAVTAGGDEARLGTLRYAVSDPTAAQASARELAWADAVAKATHWATLAGRALGEVVWVQEGVADAAPMFARVAAAPMGLAIPVEAGEQAVRADVTVRYAWAD